MSSNKNCKCLKTLNGYMVNIRNFCFFTNDNFVYQPWKKTIEKGILPPPNEYGRLKGLELKERRMTDAEQAKADLIKKNLEANPRYGLGKPKERAKPCKMSLGDLANLKISA